MVLLISYLLSALACTALYPVTGSVSARRIDRKHIQALQRKAADRFSKSLLAVSEGGVDVKSDPGVKNITFSNPAASGKYLGTHVALGTGVDYTAAFYVDGTTIPEVDWDVGPSWAGLLPISGDPDETRKVLCSVGGPC